MNLPPDLFPSEADIHDLDFLRGDNVSIESASTTNYWENGVAIYIVRRFATDEQALRHYDFDAQVKFTRRSNENSNVVNYKSIEANNSSTQCGYVLNDFRCIYIARYEEFTIFFSGSIGENEMSKHDFLQVIMYIDDRIKSLLKQYLRQLCSRNWFKSGMNHAQTGNLLENLS